MSSEIYDNPNVLSNEKIEREIQQLAGADPGLGSVMHTLTIYSDLIGDIGVRLRAKEVLPRLNEVLAAVRSEGLDMDWPTIQSRLELTIDEKVGHKFGQTVSSEEFAWSQMKEVGNLIREGLSRSRLFDPDRKF